MAISSREAHIAAMTALTLKLHNRIRDIGESAWNSLRHDDNPFTSYAYLEALEATGCVDQASGWQPVHLSLSDEAGIIRGVMPLYVKYHSMGEYVFDQSWARAYEQAGGDYYPKLQGAIPFTPVTGARLISPDAEVRQALARAAISLCNSNKLSSLHITFPREDEWMMMGEWACCNARTSSSGGIITAMRRLMISWRSCPPIAARSSDASGAMSSQSLICAGMSALRSPRRIWIRCTPLSKAPMTANGVRPI